MSFDPKDYEHHAPKQTLEARWKAILEKAKVLGPRALRGNKYLLITTGVILLVCAIVVWPYVEVKIDKTPLLLKASLNAVKTDTVQKEREEVKAIAIVDQSEREKRAQELERKRERRVRAAKREERTSQKLEDAMDSTGTGDIPVEKFGTEVYEHEMAEGETFKSLSKRFNISVATLKERNPKTTEEEGSVVSIPLRAVHTMKQGETLTKIGRSYLVDKRLIRIANQMKDDYLAVGQEVYIPIP